MTKNVKVFDPKQPGETLDYDANFTNWCTDRADSVVSYTAAVTAGDIVITSAAQIGNNIRVSVSGGTDRTRGKVTVKVTTAGPPVRVVEAELIIPIIER